MIAWNVTARDPPASFMTTAVQIFQCHFQSKPYNTNVKDADLSNVKNSNLSNINNADLSNVKNSDLSNINNADLSNVKNSDLSNINNADLSNVKDADLSNINHADLSNTKSLVTTLQSRDYLYSFAATSVEKLLQSQVQHQKFRKDVVVLDSSTGDMMECLYLQRVVTNPCPGYELDTDKDIVEACHSMSDLRYIVKDHETREFVQNIFCSICLKAKYPRVATLNKCTKTQSDFNLSALPDTPLALALNDLTEASLTITTDETECISSTTQRLGTLWADPQGRCIPTRCAPGKQHKGSNCIEIMKEVTDLVYNVRLWYVIDKKDNLAQWELFNKVYTLKSYLELFSLQLELELLELTSYYDIDIAIIPERSSCYGFELHNHLAVLWVNAIVKGPNSTPRTDFETNLLKKLLKKDLNLQLPTNQVIVAKPHAIFQDSIFAKVQLNRLFGHIFFKEKAKSYWVNKRGTTLKTLFVHTFKNCLLILKSIQPSTRPIYQELESDRKHYLNVNQLLLCQFISLNQSAYKMAINDTVIPPKVAITLDFRVTQIHITDSDNLFMVDVSDSGQLDVCIDMIDRKLIEPKLRIRKIKSNRTKNTF
ncbi:uncharacterized protein LOC129924836 [Biomphalaria glabrata]|uniref:Uncharacterized protein LOC129924836 n=1 Tax=Biomphalaria glabrata TaxID=6526 RepID=A0A9W2ZT83_BIOGL|nr:uncharacterized protein LOC129924836 [Biomphalaria glabrata]